MTPDQLRARIMEAAETEPDPSRIATALLRELDPAGIRAAAELGFAGYVARCVKRPHVIRVEQPTIAADGTLRPSAKQLDIVDWYNRQIGASVSVAGTWKPLGACTASDLVLLAKAREQHAAHVLAKATKYEKLSQAVRDAGVATVRELDPEIGEAILRS